MSQSSTTSPSSTTSSVGQTPRQDALMNFCRNNGLRTPSWQILSDRRGGRTAWSCVVDVGGQHVSARYWYDGQYVNNAREDAAERALQMLGQLPNPAAPQSIYQQQQRPV